MKFKALLTAGTVLATTTMIAAAPVMAAPGFGNFNKRVERQANRIESGFDSGALTRQEYRKLKRQNKNIRKMIRFARRDDGALDRGERRMISRALNNASDRIYRLKHNHKTQYKVSPKHKYGKKQNRFDKFSKYKNIDTRDVYRDRDGSVWVKISSWF